MTVYLDMVFFLNFLLNLLLLLGAAGATDTPAPLARLCAGAGLGAVYAVMTYLPGLSFLGNFLWRCVFLGLMLAAAFGPGRNALRPGVVFVGLSFALGGCMAHVPGPSFFLLLAVAAVSCLLCGLLPGNGRSLVPVRIVAGEKQLRLTALKDTGNTLRDPISGERVLVVQWSEGKRLLPGGISADTPVDALAKLRRVAPQVKPRLLPYRAVGQEQGLLLAVRCDKVTIGGKAAGTLVAFTNTVLSENGQFQALAGGNLL